MPFCLAKKLGRGSPTAKAIFKFAEDRPVGPYDSSLLGLCSLYIGSHTENAIMSNKKLGRGSPAAEAIFKFAEDK